MNKKTLSQSTAAKVRIIAGQWRGRKLPVANALGLRPTGDRLRETLFNWLIPDIAGARCLDAFAGSGALGLESLSRGAAFTQFIEMNATTAKQISDNIKQLKCTNANVDCIDFTQWRQSSFEPFDIVFIDPPFDLHLWEKALKHIETNIPLNPEALIYIESPTSIQIEVPNEWSAYKHKQLGQISASVYKTKPSYPS